MGKKKSSTVNDPADTKHSLGVMIDKQMKIKFQELKIEALDSQYDLINLSIYELSINLSSLLPHVGTQSLGGKRIENKLILENSSKALSSAMQLCASCGFDMPDLEDFTDYGEIIPMEIQRDTTLSILDALASLHSIACSIYVESETPIWDEEQMPEDFYEGMLGLVINIINIASKFGYGLKDLLEAM